ncbi:hypothetical protein M0804_010234 [Polistes exclamans]|nr:hypothetical protein M0804_010234 [Polistes exclamans]
MQFFGMFYFWYPVQACACHRRPCEVLTETARLLKNVKSVFTRRSNATSRANVEVELSHGFAFSQEEGGSVTQTDVIRAYDTNLPKPGGM